MEIEIEREGERERERYIYIYMHIHISIYIYIYIYALFKAYFCFKGCCHLLLLQGGVGDRPYPSSIFEGAWDLLRSCSFN